MFHLINALNYKEIINTFVICDGTYSGRVTVNSLCHVVDMVTFECQ